LRAIEIKFLKKIRCVHLLGCMFGNSAVLNLLLQVTLTTQETELKQKVAGSFIFM